MPRDADYGSDNPREEDGNRRLLELGSYVLGGMGLALVTAAGVWWLYITLQQGITYTQLGNAGTVLLFVAGFLWVMSRAPGTDDGPRLFGDHDE